MLAHAAPMIHAVHAAPVKHSETGSAAHSGKSPSKQATRSLTKIVVQPGDSVYSIARSHHSSVAAILKANPKVNVAHLVIGTTITVPTPKPAQSAHQPANKKSAPANVKKSASHEAAKKPKAPSSSNTTHVTKYAGTAAAKEYTPEQVAQGDQHREQLAQQTLPNRDQIKQLIVTTAEKYGLNPHLALAIAWQESGWQQNAVSVCDAIGTMQVMPQTGQWAGGIVHRPLDLMQPEDNVTAGVVLLRYLTQHAKSQDEAIGGYYQGLTAIRHHGYYSDTRQYIADVKAHLAHLNQTS